ncbi:MAG: acetate--CoA ligase [Armatimonadetes bacterium]|nr:acetate--CoA ligase [Armatimonadota bacterium]
MSETSHRGEIAELLTEGRVLKPSADFRAQAQYADPEIYARAAADPEGYWADWARQLHWFEPWSEVLEWEPPYAKWFVGGTLNACYNCVDRHVFNGLRNKAAIVWEGEPGDRRTLTYWDLYREVNRFANALKARGIGKGDRVAIYMPMIPELVIAMLACARIGAVHSVVFGGFSAEALADRINDAQATALITADGGYRRGTIIPLKHDADYALRTTPTIRHVFMVQRGSFPLRVVEGRDHWWHRAMQDAEPYCEPEPMDSEDMLYTLYTSGTTGKPKGIIHTTGGYLTGCLATTKMVFDLRPTDVFWCTADIGWVTGHSYVVYGPLAAGATIVMYEGAPDWPDRDRFWQIVEDFGVTIFYTAPTAIRAFMKWGKQFPQQHDLSSLRLLGTVGEPINPEAWMWYYETIGGGRCPVVDTWWQTETGHLLITTLPGIHDMKPGSAGVPIPGVEAAILTEDGQPIGKGGGYLALTRPWPGMLRGIYGDPERFVQQYWSKWPGLYFTSDGAKRDQDGYYTLLGRVDDVLNVAGHRIGTMEVESALVDHQSVAEAACVGAHDEIKGAAIVAFVTLKAGTLPSLDLEGELREHVARKIGAIARPQRVIFSGDLPKTRSGKIMRRLLRDIAEGRVLGDTTTLADASVVDSLKRQYEEREEAG